MPQRSISKFQKEIAARLGLLLSNDSYDVAAAKIMDLVAQAVKHFPSKPSSTEQRKFAKSLGLAVAKDSMRVASAKISDALVVKNAKALARLQLSKGDKVIYTEKYNYGNGLQTNTSEHIVSSIGRNGRVYFKGIGCQSAWPSQLKRARPKNSLKR